MRGETVKIQNEIEELLGRLWVTWTITLVGDDCPKFCTDRGKPGIGTYPRKHHIHGQHYVMNLTRVGKPAIVVIDFWNSYHDAMIAKTGLVSVPFARVVADGTRRATIEERRDAKVTPADVLSCCEFQDAGTFEEFCGEFGYDTDSRKAESVYRAVQEQWADLKRMFTAEELIEIEEKVREL